MFAIDKVLCSFEARSNKLLLFINFNENKEHCTFFLFYAFLLSFLLSKCSCTLITRGLFRSRQRRREKERGDESLLFSRTCDATKRKCHSCVSPKSERKISPPPPLLISLYDSHFPYCVRWKKEKTVRKIVRLFLGDFSLQVTR